MIRTIAPLASALLALLAGAASAQQPFTMEQILSSPFPSGLVAAPNHGKIAWVQNAEGKRNIWVAIAPDYQARPITRYEQDDGQEITALAFGPGANHLMFVRGGAPNAASEIPNPTSDPDGADRSIWILESNDGSHLTKLAEGSAPTFAPDGRTVAFVRDGQIWTVPFDEPSPRQLSETRGRATSLRWSPDGSRLAFVSARGDHAFVGVYTFSSETIRYLDPGLARDGEPAWSPDGTEVAFLREPNERDRLPFGARRSAIPWSIRVADATSGKGRVLFEADGGAGSAFQGVVSKNQLIWTDGGVVFPWEKDGWLHLYSIPGTGGEPKLLTPGELEVEDVFASPDGTSVLFSSNQDDIDRRHIWKVSASGGPPEPVTAGDSIEWSPVATGDGSAVAYLASDAITPAHARIQLGDATRALAPESMPDDFPTDLVVPQQVVLSAADGMEFHAQLFVPRSGGRHPAAIFFHGGSRRQMLLGWHYRGYYHNAYALNQYLASRGYVVLSVNYRSGTGYGMEFREALDYGATGASEFRDVIGAGLYLRSRDDVDPNRIGLWGGSYGGYLTALGLSRASDLFAAGVDIHGVHDWNVVIRNFVPAYNAEKHASFARLAFESSPMASMDGWRSPVLLIHGDDDRNVPFSESVDLAEALAKRGVVYEELVFPDEVHGFLLHSNWLAAYRAAADFFDRTLGGAPPVTSQP